MLIKCITLHNFRQFKGKQKLVFSNDPKKNVTVLLGDNTFGKTTILQAFNWCLYGIADFPKDSNPDFLLNLEVSNELAGVQQKSEVYVEVILEHKGMEYIILRKQPYVDRGYGNWTALQYQLTVSYKENGITKQVREGEEQRIINSILPQSLSGYFFFDTERVSDISSRKDLSDAVRGLLGLAAVGNARKHLGSRTLKATAIGQWNASLDSSGDERARQAQETIARETEHMEALEREIDSAEKELISLNAQKEKIAEILRDNQNTAELQRKKQVLEDRLESERKELEACNRLFLDFFSNSAITYFMLPLMDQAETCLVDANVDDRGIRDMTESSIRDIIKRRRCICGAELEVSEDGKTGNSAYLHILEELRYVPPAHIGTAIQNFKQLLTVDRRNVSLFYPTIEQKYKEIQKHRDSIASLEDEIARIDESIFGKENMGSYEADMNRIKENIKAFKRYIDVYMAGAALGALYERRAEQSDSTDRARIYSDAFNTEHVKCNELFRTVILADTTKSWSPEERANICFRYRDKMDENAVPPVTQEEVDIMREALALFNAYVLGGIEILYDSFSSSATISMDETVDYAYKTIFDQHSLIESRSDGDDDDQLLRPEY